MSSSGRKGRDPLTTEIRLTMAFRQWEMYKIKNDRIKEGLDEWL